MDIVRLLLPSFGPPSDTLPAVFCSINKLEALPEFVACFNHDHENDTILPGVKPTGKTLRIPMVAIVQFRGDKLCSERLYWDQAAVLAQVGLLDPSQLPVTGAEAAEAVLDQEVALNTLRADQWWKQSEAKN